MQTQSYSKHTQIVPGFLALLFLLLVTLIGAGVNLYKSIGTAGLYSASLISVLAMAMLVLASFVRQFVTKNQDRAIRAEENVRHLALTGKLLDSSLNMRQIIALRFAPDVEFPALAQRAAKEQMSPKDIKRAVKNWRPDYHRV